MLRTKHPDHTSEDGLIEPIDSDGHQPKLRNLANRKERKRTQTMNTAFEDLRQHIPNVPTDTKLSKIKTLRLAICYIKHLMDVLEESKDGGPCSTKRFVVEMALQSDMKERKRREQSKSSECEQVDDKEPKEEEIPCSSKKPKLLEYDVDREEKLQKPQAILEGRELWECFYRLGTEMIITKSGRRMFPPLRVSFAGLDTTKSYAVVLDIVPLDNKRHRYSYTDSAWFVAGEADPTPPRRVYTHPESPFSGDELSRQVLSFERVKLTNNPKDSNGNIILNSMHKYQPRVHLIQTSSDGPISEQDLDKADTFVFHETAFMAVTAYQNHLITRLKIYSNPFAKGFRDTTRLLPNFEEDSYVMRSDEYTRCCDSMDGICCPLSAPISCYRDARTSIDPRLLASQDTRWACSEECCTGSDYTWRTAHGSSLAYARALDLYSADSTPRYALLSCSPTLADERLRDY